MRSSLQKLVFLFLTPLCAAQATNITGPLQTTSGTGFTGAPYSGKETTVAVRTFSDGTEVTQVFETLLWRDSQGRTRQEMIRHNEAGGEFRSVIITDLVDGVYRKWETGETSAKREVGIWSVPVGLRARAPAAQPNAITQPRLATAPSDPQATEQTIVIAQSPVVEQSPANTGVQHEKLSPQFINGVWAEGSRTVRYIPVDEGKNGEGKNGRVLQVVNELWISPELKIIVRHVVDDPRTGLTTTDITDVALGDPDPALFEPPPGYALEDHRGQTGK